MAPYNPRTWIAREGTNLNKFTKSSETASSVILENAPDAITQAGTPFTAAAMNNIETGISALYVYDARGLGQTARDWRGGAAAPNGDVYASVLDGDIYKQTGGTGDFVALGQTTRNWYGMTAAPNGDIYAGVFGGDIYKQTGGTGDFVALGQTPRQWFGIAAAPNGDIYATVVNGDIYKQTGGTGDFVALGQTPREWWGIAAAPNGDIYAGVFNGDIYKQSGGTGDFVALGQTPRYWSGMAAAPNGAVYASVLDGDIYTLAYYPKTGGVGSLYIGLFSAPASVLLFDGSLKARAAYPELWAMISAGRLPSVTDAVWLTNTAAARLAGAVGAFSTGDGSTTFRLPDWRGVFLRGAGTNSVLAMANATKYEGGALAAVMLDAMQGHRHNWITPASASGGNMVSYPVYADTCSEVALTSVGNIIDPSTDGANGDPRKDKETRPVSVSLNFGIYFE